MNRFNVTFKGMSNVPDDGFGEAGDMALLLNMRHKGGELVQCQPPAVEPAVAVKQVLYHAQSGEWLTLSTHYKITIGGETVSGVKYFAVMGNVVILYKEKSVEYAIWRDGKYVYLGPLPEAPLLTATGLTEISKRRTTEEKYYEKYDKNNKELWYRNVQKGFVDEILDSIYNECGYVDRALFRVGLKMFDGTYIALSGIYQLSARRTGENDAIGAQDLFVPWNSNADPKQYLAEVRYFKPQLQVGAIDSNWRDVISSVDVFTTGSIMNYVVAKERGERSSIVQTEGEISAIMTDTYEWYRPSTAEEFKEAFVNAEYYKVAEFDLNGKEMWKVDNTSPSVLANQTHLSEIQYHSYVAKSTQVYNARLHSVVDKTVFFQGFNPSYKYDGAEAREREHDVWKIVVYIDTDAGERRVVLTEKDKNKDLLYYFVYPDSRAKRMEIFRYESGTGTVKAVIPLTAHKFRDEAYYLDVEQQIKAIGNKTYVVSVIKTDIEWIRITSEVIPGSYEYYERPGILKVSAVDNPFYFPTAQTYKFEGEIVGLASNAEAISTGQFGLYPLFVFTQEGVWAMGVDTSGQGAYTTQSPFSREVCSGAICPVSGGIVFTTRRGVMAISGGQVTELSTPLDGPKAEMLTASSNILGLIAEKGGFTLPDVVPVRKYIEGAKLAYNYLHNEVILSNVEYPYSYVYALTDGVWSLINTTFDVTTNSYPELVVYNSNETKKLTFNDGDNGTPGVLAVTRPFTLGSLEYKRLRQAALRCTYEPRLNFYLLGSNDGANFACLTGKETERDFTRRDLVTPMSRSRQYKYFAIAIAGQMKGRVTLAELLVDAGMNNNKLG